MPPTMKVLISGAGIGGTALAFWLSKFPHLFSVTVVEQHPELRTTGLQVDLRGHGITVIRYMGLEDKIRAKCVAEQGIQLVDTRGKRWAYLPANTSGKGPQSFTSEFEIMRGDLCRTFRDEAVKGVVQYKFGMSMVDLRHEDEGVFVGFTDGTTERFDLVVGADGLYSKTRQLMLKSDEPDPCKPLHRRIAYAMVPKKAKEGEKYYATAYLGTNSRMLMTRRNNPDELQLYLFGSHVDDKLESVDRHDSQAQKDIYASAFRGAGWEADELMDLLAKSNNFYCQREAWVKLKPWSRGNVTLLGDAGYCVSVNGHGTSSAVIAAYVLAGELVQHATPGRRVTDSVQAALKGYEDVHRPFVDLSQRGFKEDGGGEHLLRDWQIPLILWAAWILTILRLHNLASLFTDRGTGSWHLPQYPELTADKD